MPWRQPIQAVDAEGLVQDFASAAVAPVVLDVVEIARQAAAAHVVPAVETPAVAVPVPVQQIVVEVVRKVVAQAVLECV